MVPPLRRTAERAGWGLTGTGCGSRSRGLVAEHTLLVAIAQIAGRSCQTAMAKQQLNGADVNSLFQQVNGESVAQAMRCDRLGECWQTRCVC